MKNKIIIAISVIISVFLLLSLLFVSSKILIPKSTNPRERGLIKEYYDEVEIGREHQVIFIGDCEVYESFTPPTLWNEYGITSYIRGSAQQLIWQSYYLLYEVFEYEIPEIVVFNVLSLKYGEPQKEEYNRLTLDGMKNSSIKHNAIKASITKDESVLSYYFPILRYHLRWKDLTKDDYIYAFYDEKVSHNGYLMMTNIEPKVENREPEGLIDYNLPEICFEYLDKMYTLCKNNGAELILIKAPTNSYNYWWYDEWDKQVLEYAKSLGISYYNFIGNEEIGIDWSTDTYDAGVHLNVYGAQKLTSYFGNILINNHNIKPIDPKNTSDVWQEKYKRFINEEELQKNQ